MAATSTNWWIQIPGVTGSGPAPVTGYIELLDFNLNLTSEVSGNAGPPAKPVVHPCSVGLKGDDAAGALFTAMTGSTPLASIVVQGLKVANKALATFIKYTFTNAFVVNLSFSQGLDGGLAIGSFVFTAATVAVQPYTLSSTGNYTAGTLVTYDIVKQTVT